MSGPLLPPLGEYPPEVRADLARRYRELAVVQLDLVLNAVEQFESRVAAVAQTFADLAELGHPVEDPDGWVTAAQAHAAVLREDLIVSGYADAVNKAERFMNAPRPDALDTL